MGTVEHFEHTADVGFRVRASDPEELFETAAEGLFDYIVVNRSAVAADVAETVAMQAGSMGDLLIAWLNELIFRFETEHRLYTRFDVQLSEDGTSLDARIAGEPIDNDRHVLDHEVKAVTWHGASLRREGDGWVAEMILDI